MKTSFNINPDYDIRLIPFSPVSENDILEIRVQGFNDGDCGETEVIFRIDDEVVSTQKIRVESQKYGFASCRVPMKDRCGNHKVYINGQSVDLDVLKEAKPKLDGGFAMIGPPNDRVPVNALREDLKSFTDDDWGRYIDGLTEIGCKCIIFHNCQEYLLYNNFNPDPKDLRAHYNSKMYPKSDIKSDDPIGVVLKKAEEHGIQVFISVGNCFGHMAGSDDFYEMFELFGKYKSFYGWYLSNELDMKNFDMDGWEILRRQAKTIREISPVKPILVSPYEFPGEEVIEYMKTKDVFDIMMPQDCVGQGRLNLSQSDNMYKILSDVCAEIKKHLWANCEAFDFLDGVLVPRFKNGGMDGEIGFVQQIQTVRPYVEKIMNFAYTGFFTPSGFVPKVGGDAAVKQFEDYKKYMESL